MQHNKPTAERPEKDRRGVVIVAVLIVVVLLSLAAYQYSDLMLAEYRAAENVHRNLQARALAESGVHYAAAALSNPTNLENLLGENPWDNPDVFREVPVPGDDNLGLPGYFTLIAPPDPDDPGGAVRHGVTDECGKINLNALLKLDPSGQRAVDMLMRLPGMTEDVANAIVDYVDSDSEPRPAGAENDYYGGLSSPYRAKNGPLDSVDELLLVRGVTKDLLVGGDTNRNGVQDEDETGGESGFTLGWAAYLTVHSREQNRDPAGNAYVFVNNPDLNDLYEKLSAEVGDELAKYVVMYRQYGPSNPSGQQQNFGSALSALFGGRGKKGSSPTASTRTVEGSLSEFEVDFSKRAKTKLKSLFDLINTQVSVPGKEQGAPTQVFKSPLNDVARQRELLPQLFSSATLVEEAEIPPRININTAPAEVLATIPELSEADVSNILSLRPKPGSSLTEVFQTPTWLLTEANLSLQTLKQLDKYVTTRSQVYRVQSVGYFDGRGPAARVEAVIDTNGGRPRIVSFRDLTELGKGWEP